METCIKWSLKDTHITLKRDSLRFMTKIQDSLRFMTKTHIFHLKEIQQGRFTYIYVKDTCIALEKTFSVRHVLN